MLDITDCLVKLKTNNVKRITCYNDNYETELNTIDLQGTNASYIAKLLQNIGVETKLGYEDGMEHILNSYALVRNEILESLEDKSKESYRALVHRALYCIAKASDTHDISSRLLSYDLETHGPINIALSKIGYESSTAELILQSIINLELTSMAAIALASLLLNMDFLCSNNYPILIDRYLAVQIIAINADRVALRHDIKKYNQVKVDFCDMILRATRDSYNYYIDRYIIKDGKTVKSFGSK